MTLYALFLAATAGLPADTVPLYTTLGDHHFAVTTSVPEAQRYFDQGLRLYYAFNHAEAVRSFREAQRLDPRCAMCAWGEALALGPNINAAMDSASGAAALLAARRAGERQLGATERERLLIAALLTRYAPEVTASRAHLDLAYARAMAEAARRFPQETEFAVLAAEAAMDTRPWDYWVRPSGPEGPWLLQAGLDEAGRWLERAVLADPKHPGACHLYTHFVEAAYPEKAVACAERLAALMPGAGHIVHMPGHIYIRVGRYEDAIRANEHAVHADERYIRDQRPGLGTYTAGYYPHNYDFLAFAAAMAGHEEQAIAAADKLAELAAPYMTEPGMAFAQHHATRHLQMRVRFGRWEEILATPAPDVTALHATAIWHYARGRALVARGSIGGAECELLELRRIAADRALQGLRLEFNESDAILRIAINVLAGQIAAARHDHPAAIASLQEAVRAEDALRYGEPPDWSIPVRQELGAMLVVAGRPAEGARVYREDLARFPRNGWSERGLRLATAPGSVRAPPEGER